MKRTTPYLSVAALALSVVGLSGCGGHAST